MDNGFDDLLLGRREVPPVDEERDLERFGDALHGGVTALGAKLAPVFVLVVGRWVAHCGQVEGVPHSDIRLDGR